MNGNPSLAPRRTLAVLKGATEAENLGDRLMQGVARQAIEQLGFDRIVVAPHRYCLEDLPEPEEVGAVFVLGSIQFTDAWRDPLVGRLDRANAFHQRYGTAPTVFLPSSFGPFKGEEQVVLRDLVQGRRVYARDRLSFGHLVGATVDADVRYCPDFAFAAAPSGLELGRRWLADQGLDGRSPTLGIIPNSRCLEVGVTPLDRPGDYLDYLRSAIDWGRNAGFQVVAISHMIGTERDADIARALGLPTLRSDAADLVRSVIACLTLCVCSRYHGLISCLSHGVPTVAVGWHHKYQALMADIGLASFDCGLRTGPLRPIGDVLGQAAYAGRTLQAAIGEQVRDFRLRIDSEIGALESAPGMATSPIPRAG